jgi:PleD family two-component response regulator
MVRYCTFTYVRNQRASRRRDSSRAAFLVIGLLPDWNQVLAKILVVDDNPDERRIYSALLYYNGFDVLEASSGDEAISLARADKPDVVLVDYMMPVMSGLMVAETCVPCPKKLVFGLERLIPQPPA